MRIGFSEFRLDTLRFLLRRSGEGVALRPKVFDLLIYLVDHRERVVPREELVERLWGTTAVGSGSLSGLVNELRKALGEPGNANSSIRTVHARGYQFVAEVIREEEIGREMSTDVAEPSIAKRMDDSRSDLRAVLGGEGVRLLPDRLVVELLHHLRDARVEVEAKNRLEPAEEAASVEPPRAPRMRLARSKWAARRTRRGPS